MKINIFRAVLIILLMAISLQAVESDTTGFSFSGTIGLDFIRELMAEDVDTMTFWFNIALKPEISIQNFGIGLYLPFRISNEGEFRNEDWDSPSDFASIIRYIRYGKRGTPMWVKAGVLEGVSMGYGLIMDDYRNTIDENTRKTGFQIASDLEKGGGEILVSNLGNAEIMGLRGFVRPVKFLTSFPVVSNLELGSTIMKDFEVPDSVSISMMGLEAGLPILNTFILDWQIYTHYANILDYGNGFGYGTRVDFDFFMKILTLSFKLEKREIGDEFIPSYFGPFYEVHRNTLPAALETVEKTDGYYGGVYVSILDKLDLIGKYQWTDERESGILNLSVDATRLIPQVPITFTYSKMGITKSSEIFDLGYDEDVILYLSVAPQIIPHIYLIGTGERRFMLVDEEEEIYEHIDKYSLALGYQF